MVTFSNFAKIEKKNSWRVDRNKKKREEILVKVSPLAFCMIRIYRMAYSASIRLRREENDFSNSSFGPTINLSNSR